MTTANLIVYDLETSNIKTYKIWHDGYQVGLMLRDLKNFEMETLDKQLKEKDFEAVPTYNAERGDWAYTLTIKNKNEAILLGAGYKKIYTEKLYANNQIKEEQKQNENIQKPKPVPKKKAPTP